MTMFPRQFGRLSRLAGLAAVAAVALSLAGCSGCEGSSEAGADTSLDTNGESTTSDSGAGSTTESTDPSTADATDKTNNDKAIQTDKSATLSEKPPLEIDGLLTAEDVSSLDEGRSFEATDLVGQAPTPSYNSVRFKPTSSNDSQTYGAGLQVWSFETTKAAGERFGSLKNQYLDVSEPTSDFNTPGVAAFLSERGGIKQLVVRLNQPPRILAVSCSPSVCESNKSMATLVQQVAERLTQRADSRESSESNTSDSNDSSETDTSTGSSQTGAATPDTGN